jgi:DNA-binding CsgD family transcriptional regulator
MMAYIFVKIPLYNVEKKCIGTIFHGTNVTNTSHIELGSMLSCFKTDSFKNKLLGQSSYLLTTSFNKIQLTERQAEVLFYILRGKTVKQVSTFLLISPRTVDEHLEQLRHKFEVNNKHALIDKEIFCGFLNTIPDKLFRQQLSMELKS